MKDTFTFVLIPSDAKEELKEVTWTQGGTFNNDGLKAYANQYFEKKRGAALELTGLDMPREANDYMAVTMYTDINASEEKKPLNERATDLAKACGQLTKKILGDAFVARALNVKHTPW